MAKGRSEFKREMEKKKLKKQEETILGSFAVNRDRKWSRARKGK